MGCDIHFYVERKQDGRWVSADKWTPDEYEGAEPKPLTVAYGDHLYDDRSYDTFAILANVRNGRGFADVDTGDGFIPICEPRGLPDDMSPELVGEAERCLEHTPSWLTVAELLAYDWTRTTNKRGWLSGVEFEEWSRCKRTHGEGPDNWCGSVSGGMTEHVTIEGMDRALADLREKFPDKHAFRDALTMRLGQTYCPVQWTRTYAEAAQGFLIKCLPKLLRLGSPEDVRCVFWFDS